MEKTSPTLFLFLERNLDKTKKFFSLTVFILRNYALFFWQPKNARVRTFFTNIHILKLLPDEMIGGRFALEEEERQKRLQKEEGERKKRLVWEKKWLEAKRNHSS